MTIAKRSAKLVVGTALAVLAGLTATTAAWAQSAPVATPAKTPEWRNFPPRAQAPAGAPNVLVVLLDDVGFAAGSTFGGLIPTPHLDALAAHGLRFNRFHVTAMCSPTRAALLTGRNTHAVATGSITNVAIDEKGYTSVIPKSAATIGRVLRDAGYNTAFFGKNHNTPEWEAGPLGPFDRWPNGLGFEYFYGFNAAQTSQFVPVLTENVNTARRPADEPGYILDRDLGDRVIHWLRLQHSLQPDRPFLTYWAPSTMHAPQHAPAEWIARFKGAFDMGWDEMRSQIFKRQKASGIIPADARLNPRPSHIPAWASLPEEQKRVHLRQMEVAAAQLAYFDEQFGRVVAELKASGQFDNTLILFVDGDNGASIAGGLTGTWGGPRETTIKDMTARYNELGSTTTGGDYPAGWAYATDTPFPKAKGSASHLGGIRNGLVVSWPRGIKQQGAIRGQFGHVNDLAPTIYEAAGITPPETVDGVKQQPFDGVSLLYAFNDAKAPDRHREQYFEMTGSVGYYKDHWFASAEAVKEPGRLVSNVNELTWELYDLSKDFSQTQNVASLHPEKLAELKAAFEAAAQRNNVYPLNNQHFPRADPALRPPLRQPTQTQAFSAGDTRYPAGAWPDLQPGLTIVADVQVATASEAGPILSAGLTAAGYTLRLNDGRPVFAFGQTGPTLRGPALLAGAHRISIAFEAAADKALEVALLVDGNIADRATIPAGPRRYSPSYVGRRSEDDFSGQAKCSCIVDQVRFQLTQRAGD